MTVIQQNDGDMKINATQEEIDKCVTKMMYGYFLGRQFVRANFWSIQIPWSDPRVMQTIVKNQKKWLPLHKMVNRLEDGSRFDFWRTVFENRKNIPLKELLQVWYGCLNDRGCRNYQRVTTEHGYEVYDSLNSVNENQAASVITDQLLIDDPIVSYRYCQVRKPGWQMLQYIHGRRHQTVKMSDAMRQAIREDDLPIFAINRDMAGMNVSFSMLVEVLESGAACIFRYLLEKRLFNDSAISLSELCCLLVAWYHDGISVPMLAVLDEVHPGLVQSVADDFGRNLLWYAIQNTKTGWFHPDCRLTPFLLEHGCDPQNTNQIGLPWQMVTDGLSLDLKEQMMRRRYNMEHYTQKLRQYQPLEHLKQP